MPFDQLVLLVLFVVATAGSPGPANLAFAASSARFGVRRTAPFLLGSQLGFLVVFVLITSGTIAALKAYPAVWVLLRFLCFVYILYLGWKIGFQGIAIGTGSVAAPSFLRGVFIHPLNPKAYAMLTAAAAQFIRPEAPWISAGIVAAVYLTFGTLLNGAWLLAGSYVTRTVGREARMIIIARILALLMVLVTAYSLYLVS